MDAALVICRGLNFASSLIIFGGLVFQTMIAPTKLALSLEPSLRPIVRVASIVAALTGVIWLIVLASSMGEDSDGWLSIEILSTVLFATAFGRVWQWHLMISAAIVFVALVGAALPRGLRAPLLLILSLGQVLTLALVGHAVMLSGAWGVVNRLTQGLHLVAAGYWLGCLPAVIICLNVKDADLREPTLTALRRFSSVGHVAVAGVILSGILNTGLIEGQLGFNPAIPYQALLDVKIAAVLAMLSLALVNRYYLVPSLRLDAGAIETIRRSSIAIFALGLAAVALVGVFGTFSPT